MSVQERRPIKVLQVGMTRNLGGLETYLIEQFRYLDVTNLHFDFVNITGEHRICFDEEIKTKQGKIFSVVSRHKNPLKHYYQWYALLKEHHHEYDVIIYNTNSLEYIFPLVIAKWFNIPVRIIHSHNAGFENSQGYIRKLLVELNTMLMNWSATDYFACSDKAGRWMFTDKAFYVVKNAIDSSQYIFNSSIRKQVREQLQISDNTIVCIHIGRFTYQKNHSLVVDIFNEYHKKNSDSILLLVGKNDESTSFLENTKEKIKLYGLQDAVKLLGMRHDVPNLMQASDLCLMPSIFEGFGIVAIEAQAASLPILVSNTFPNEVFISNYIDAVALDAPIDTWIQKIESLIQLGRFNQYDLIRDNGYEINQEIKILDSILESLIYRDFVKGRNYNRG